MTTYIGPFDRESWPEKLVAHVVEPGAMPHVHGYDIASLARGTGLVDLVWLTLAGELPTVEQRAALEAATMLLAPIHIGEAASHAALLSRLAGAPATTTIAIGAVGLGEMVRTEQAALAPWLAWLDAPEGDVPAAARDRDPCEASAALQRWVHWRMVAWFGAGLPDVPLTRVACAYAILHRMNLRTPLVLELLAMWARLPAIAAEAAHAGAVKLYPARLPDFQYVDDRGATR